MGQFLVLATCSLLVVCWLPFVGCGFICCLLVVVSCFVFLVSCFLQLVSCFFFRFSCNFSLFGVQECYRIGITSVDSKNYRTFDQLDREKSFYQHFPVFIFG